MFGKTKVTIVTPKLDLCDERKLARVPVRGELISVNQILCRVRAVIFDRKSPGSVEVVVAPVVPRIDKCYQDTDKLKELFKKAVV